ncbi:MAG: PQQ-binding-like beta-propeller repeat protein [Phycisphaerae bacterium]
MRHIPFRLLPVFLLLAVSATTRAEDWNQFRGPRCDGVTAIKGLPLTWSAAENRLWKRELPGPGTSQPVVWGDRIFVTAFSGYGERRGKGNQPEDQSMRDLRLHVLCLARDDGKVLWRKDHSPLGPVTPANSNVMLHGYASPTPYVDTDRLYVSFGPAGVFTLDHDGAEQWKMRPGTIAHIWGSAASLVTCGDLLLINASSEADALIAVDKATGREVWRTTDGFKTRSKWNRSWSTPMVLPAGDGAKQIVLLSIGAVYAYDPQDGRTLWSFPTRQGYASNNPTWHGDVLYAVVGSSHGDAVSWALKLNPAVDRKARVLWKVEDTGANINSAVYHDGYLYWAAFAGGLRPPEARGFCCLDAETRELAYRESPNSKLGRGRGASIFASTLLADGRLYYVSQALGTWVVEASPEFKVLAHNTLEDDEAWFNASPVPMAGGRLLLRSDWGLHCLGTADAKETP